MSYFFISIIILAILFIFLYFIIFKKTSVENESPIDLVPKIIVNIEDLEKHSEEIARDCIVMDEKRYNKKLMQNLDESFNKLVENHKKINDYYENTNDRVCSAEWILDNMFLIQKEYKYIKNNVSKKDFKGIPVLTKGIMKGYPRIYDIAVEIVSHTDGNIDEKVLNKFLKAYQKNAVLTSQELNMIPIMIRVALIQNISNLTSNIVFIQEQKSKGDSLADEVINFCHNSNKNKNDIQDIFNKNIEFNDFFAERFLKILKDNCIENDEIYNWINENLEMNETNYQNIVLEEHKKEASMQISMANSINSLRRIEGMNWSKSFEKLSYVENLLLKDPLGIYSKMDFDSREFYRYKIGKLSKKYNIPESFIVKKAIECAKEAKENSKEDYKIHVGYYLIDDGINILKSKLKVKDNCFERIKNFFSKRKVSSYVGSIILFTALIMCIFLYLSLQNDNNVVLWRYIVACIILLVPCSEIIISILNWSINCLSEPRFIPKLDLKDGILDEFKTVIIIPTIISKESKIDELIQNMETYYLANKSKNLFLALLGDVKDSDSKIEFDDSNLVKYTLNKIKKLNQKYSKDKDIFFYFCRERKYNEKEEKWIAWERKRGKIMEFNRLLRGDTKTSYNVISGNIDELKKCKYVITLDADTKLPRNSAVKLIGAMAHVLNKPKICKVRNNLRVIRGYGLLQPRIGIDVESSNKTLFSRIFSGEVGIDVYTKAISDVYQDLFGEGIFTGKGIYDIDVFNLMLKDRVQENTVLSHDLLEGSYVRAGLITDVELIDDYPSYYSSSCKRLHRWVRGDWQLFPWIIHKRGLNNLSIWKIVDNLRRSLLAPSIMLLFALSYNILPDGTDKWIVAAILAIISPMLFDVTEFITSPIKGISLSGRISGSKMVFSQVFLIFCFLPYQAYLMLDAIIRTIYRLTISKKHFLEWQTADDAEKGAEKTVKGYLKLMWKGSLISLIILFLAFMKSSSDGFSMLPFSVIWFISPFIAYYISKDIKTSTDSSETLTDTDKVYISCIARKIWAYFEDFVSEETNWLAPDNYQEYAQKGIAYRTSPTNLGMGLISNICAYDLGYIGILQLIDRMKNIIKNMNKLEKLKGHFYNWYDIKTMKPLEPKYISTVDSGNLIGYLWVIEEALKEYKISAFNENNIKRYSLGLRDIILLAQDEVKKEIKIDDYYNDVLKMLNKDLSVDDFMHLLNDLENKVKKQNICDLYWNKKLYTSVQNLKLEIDKLFCKSNEEMKKEILNELDEIINEIKSIADNTDFKLLFDKDREMFSIGYDVHKNSIGNCYYDLLASEARQAVFVAIAKGDISDVIWFKLGRSLGNLNGKKALASWSGTMFEYFMPLLIMKRFPNTLLYETYNSVIDAQMKYCNSKNIPWGISESAFYSFDKQLNYQYKAFGVPGVGVKRGLSDELVISPYSTILAMQVDKKLAINNLYKLENEDAIGRYGFYEAIDYTKSRLKGKDKEVVRCFMVHHEGMSLMSINNVLNKNILQKRFHKIPEVKASELLLQERIPKVIVYNRDEEYSNENKCNIKEQEIILREYKTAKTNIPKVQLLSNGSYNLMISNSGSGYAKNDDINIYRWRNDSVLDNYGMYFYIKNVTDDDYYSSTFQPCKKLGEKYEVKFSLDKIQFERKDGDLSTVTEIIVSNEDNGEIRKISIMNNGENDKVIFVTSYCEVNLSKYNDDLVHPSFQNLFIETEYLEEEKCIIATRRQRKDEDKKLYLMQVSLVRGDNIGNLEYETNRENFIGRGRSLENPISMERDIPLKNTSGAILDPIIALRRKLTLRPNQKCEVIYSTMVCESKEEAIKLAKKYSEYSNIERNFTLSWTKAQLDMKYLGVKSSQANLYESGASQILFVSSLLRERENYIENIKKSQMDLWKYGISGDFPIVLVICKDENEIDIVRQVIKAHEYWRAKGLICDLVILNLEEVSYVQSVQTQIKDLIFLSSLKDKQNKNGGVFLFNKSSISCEDIEFLKAISKMVIYDKESFINSMKNEEISFSESNNMKFHNKVYKIDEYQKYQFYENIRQDISKLLYFNSYGGFSKQGKEYTIILNDTKNTPAPWINVISNKTFGFHVSERGSAYTWCLNSRENKITPWSNDAVQDTFGEALYIRDNITGDRWNITAGPIRDKNDYIIKYGFGYAKFIHEHDGILGEELMFVPLNDNLKLCIVKLKNITSEMRNLSLFYYAQLVLGVVPEQTAQYIKTYFKDECLYAENPYSTNFKNMKVFLKIVGGMNDQFTCDRKEFIGSLGNLKNPDALNKENLLNISGAGFEPCLVYKTNVELNPNEEKTLIVLFGEHSDTNEINKLTKDYSNLNYVQSKFNEIKDYWDDLVSKVNIKTPDKTMDIMVNGWLMYQTIVCRIWARTAFYQSGGAYGFRDQLQDVLPLVYIDSQFTKEQILYASSKQYLEGDVQHWWHPYIESGIRTRFSDDRLWLPYVTIQYIKATGDYEILDKQTSYLSDEPLKDGEDERYNISEVSDKKGSLYEHCIKAIDISLKFGTHNIPLMGSGDWNDGMSTIGNKGKGESVWLGWFLYSILNDFIKICAYKHDNEKKLKYQEAKTFIKENLEKNAWDGNWYKRAYFDDETPLGSIQNDECQIDSLSQSWSVISKGSDMEKSKIALKSLEQHLVKEDKGMVLLLTPAFNKSKLKPGYIKGYVPGVRENGGQYTHSVTWVIQAYAELGMGDKAAKIYNMINPINHTKSYLECQTFKTEPYVMTADVYNIEPYVGRGGWSWYTGTASWMYKVAVESIIGLKLIEDKGFMIKPSIPNNWHEYSITFKKKGSTYKIKVIKNQEKKIILDNKILNGDLIPYFKKGVHNIEVYI